MIGADPAPPVDRPNLSKDYFAGNAPQEWLPLRPSEFFVEHRIMIRCSTKNSRDTGAAIPAARCPPSRPSIDSADDGRRTVGADHGSSPR